MVADKFFADNEGLRQTIGAGLHRISDVHAPLVTVSQQLGKARGVLRRADQQHIANPGQHERGQGVIHHGFVVDRHELFAHGLRHRVQARTRTTRQDDAFSLIHKHIVAWRQRDIARRCIGRALLLRWVQPASGGAAGFSLCATLSLRRANCARKGSNSSR